MTAWPRCCVANPVTHPFFPFLLHLPNVAISPLNAGGDGKLDRYVMRECNSKDTYHVNISGTAASNPTNTSPVSWPSSVAKRPTWYVCLQVEVLASTVRFFERGFPRQLNERKNNNRG